MTGAKSGGPDRMMFTAETYLDPELGPQRGRSLMMCRIGQRILVIPLGHDSWPHIWVAAAGIVALSVSLAALEVPAWLSAVLMALAAFVLVFFSNSDRPRFAAVDAGHVVAYGRRVFAWLIGRKGSMTMIEVLPAHVAWLFEPAQAVGLLGHFEAPNPEASATSLALVDGRRLSLPEAGDYPSRARVIVFELPAGGVDAILSGTAGRARPVAIERSGRVIRCSTEAHVRRRWVRLVGCVVLVIVALVLAVLTPIPWMPGASVAASLAAWLGGMSIGISPRVRVDEASVRMDRGLVTADLVDRRRRRTTVLVLDGHAVLFGYERARRIARGATF